MKCKLAFKRALYVCQEEIAKLFYNSFAICFAHTSSNLDDERALKVLSRKQSNFTKQIANSSAESRIYFSSQEIFLAMSC
jgi:hypothetical protein